MTQEREIVYVVDDDVRIRDSLSELLASFGLAVVCFGSAREYLQHNRDDTCACLVLDIEMPDLDGLELQEQLAALGPPIVFITGHGDIPRSVRAIKAGAVEFLTKPLNSEALTAAIHAGFARDQRERAANAILAVLKQRWSTLTPREREVLPLIVAGLRNKQAAWNLGITEVTMQVHRGQIMRKMAARSFAELVRMSEKLGVALPLL
jgi:FixJ family two-component response regulator